MDDLILRRQAIDALRNYLVGKNVPCDGTLTCRLIENEVISKLPSAQPKQRTGKWIPQDHNKRAGNISTCVYCYPICSKCGKVGIETYKYCPNCGSYNGGENEI